MSTTQQSFSSPDEPRRSSDASPIAPTQPDRDGGMSPRVSAAGSDDCNEGTVPISAKQQAANERNARKSTGPRTKTGKARSSLNALSHGVYGRAHAIRRGELAEEEEEVSEFIEALMDDLDPRDGQEFAVARRIAEGELRLARADRFESVGLSAAGRLAQYDRDSGLGQAQEDQRAMLIRRFRRASLLLQDPGKESDDLDWYEALDMIYLYKGVPTERYEYPEASTNQASGAGIWKRFVLDKVVPQYWPSLAAASAALEEASFKVMNLARDLDGVAEERAVESALEVGGVLDRASILRSRAQRAVERDRAMYADLRKRHLGGNDEGG
jgi:hypothetical protein